MKRTVKIRINGESWRVPRGFGAAYKREAERQIADTLKPGATVGFVIDLMSLIGYAPTPEAVEKWPLQKRVEAVVYAANVHARASDNPIQRCPAPKWLLDFVPWQGPWSAAEHMRPSLRGVFAGPTPTRIPT